MRRVLAVVAGVCALWVSSCSFIRGEPEPTAPPGGVLMRFHGGTLAAEVAADEESRQLGLMYRETLDADAGMLFLFSRPIRGSFFMKNTLIPLSIAFLSRRGTSFGVLAVLDMEPCRTDPCPLYTPRVDYAAALEVNQGWFKRHGVTVGDLGKAEASLPIPSRT